MKNSIVLLLMLINILTVKSQDYNYDWSRSLFDSILPNGVLIDTISPLSILSEYSGGIEEDHSGNSISVGTFWGGYWDLVTPIEVYATVGAASFIQKRDASGDMIWSIYLDVGNVLPSASGQVRIKDIAVDSQDNILVCGYLQDSIDFDPSIGETWGHSSTLSSGFLAKYDPNGNLLFLYLLDGAQDCQLSDVIIDSNDNVFVAGIYRGSLDFDAGPSVNMDASVGLDDDFVLKVNSSGQYQWHSVWGGTGEDDVTGLELDDVGNVLICGAFSGSADFDPGIGTSSLVSGGFTDGFVLKLDPLGNYIWVYQFKCSSSSILFDLACDGSNIGLIGTYQTSVEIDLLGTGTVVSDPISSQSVLTVVLNPMGQMLWYYSPEPLEVGMFMTGYVIEEHNGEWYPGIGFSQTADMDMSISVDSVVPTYPSRFVVKLSSSGSYQWYKQFELDGAGTTFDLQEIDVSDNAIYVAGHYSDAGLDMDPDPITVDLLPSEFNSTVFVGKLETCASFTVQPVTSCDSYTSPSGQYTWTVSGTYMDTLVNFSGCDSIIEVSLTIETIDNSVTQSSDTLQAVQAGVVYQWLDCDLGFAPIPGANSQSFVASSNGNYALEISDGACTDTSACFNISTVSLPEQNPVDFSIVPNPSRGSFELQFSNTHEQLLVQVINPIGQIILEENLFFMNAKKFEIILAPGLYTVLVKGVNSSCARKIIIR